MQGKNSQRSSHPDCTIKVRKLTSYIYNHCHDYYFCFPIITFWWHGLCDINELFLPGVYVKVSLRKMLGRRMCKELHKEIKLEVDGKHVELPPIEGIIILNIMRSEIHAPSSLLNDLFAHGSWGSGANIWGPEKDEKFTKPNHWDGMLEVVGVQGQIDSLLLTNTIILLPIKFSIATSKRCNCNQRKEIWLKCHTRCRPLGPDTEWAPSRHSHCPRKSYQNSYE